MRLTVTARVLPAADAADTDSPATYVCRTRDVSTTGILLETLEELAPGTTLDLTLLDPENGETVAMRGTVKRQVLPGGSGAPSLIGVQLDEPVREWSAIVTRAQERTRDTMERPARRLRVLVVADDVARRGAVALYVTSGWDVRFATDLASAEEALRGIHLDAVIAEHDLDDHRWTRVLEVARRAQPHARRIVRSQLAGRTAPAPGAAQDLVHRVVDLNAGLEAVFDALTADWGGG